VVDDSSCNNSEHSQSCDVREQLFLQPMQTSAMGMSMCLQFKEAGQEAVVVESSDKPDASSASELTINHSSASDDSESRPPNQPLSSTDLTVYYDKHVACNLETGRKRQTLTCLLCDGFATQRLSNMQDHVRNHLQLKPFKCRLCGHGFN